MLQTKPATSELEVSVFGPGVGECVVVHLGDGKWMVVDSCMTESGRPVALEYLSTLGVDVAADVEAVVLTHWHDDHTRGASDVLTACHKASFFCSSALNKEEFFKVVTLASAVDLRVGSGSGLDEMGRIFALLHGRRVKQSGRTASPEYVHANTIVFQSAGSAHAPACTVHAVSPSSASITRGFLSIAPKVGAAKKAFANPGPNELSVAMHIQFDNVSALLGADLEVGSSDAVGWRAVVRNTRRPTSAATLVKVPHHGSEGADHPPAWTALVAAGAFAAVTPFSSSRIPRDSDLARIGARNLRLFHASPKPGPAVRFDAATTRTLGDIKIRERRGAMGHIRFRSLNGNNRYELFGAAVAVP